MRAAIRVRLLAVAVGTAFAFAAQAPMSPPGSPSPPFFKGDKKEEEDPNGRRVRGSVKEPDGSPAGGAVVKIKNMKTLSVRSYITKDDGKYSFGSLRMDAEYRLQAEHQGRVSNVRTLSVFDERKDVTVDLRLEEKAKQ
jgi:hypothetical protein